MSSSDNEFKHESLQDNDSIVDYLSSLGEGFKKEKIVLGSKAKTLIFHPQGLLKMVVKAKKKNNRVRLVLKFTWKDGEDDNESNSQEPLIIKTREQ